MDQKLGKTREIHHLIMLSRGSCEDSFVKVIGNSLGTVSNFKTLSDHHPCRTYCHVIVSYNISGDDGIPEWGRPDGILDCERKKGI